MKTLYVLNNTVVAVAHVAQAAAHARGPEGSVGYDVSDNDPADIGWSFAMDQGAPVFSAPAAKLPVLSPPQVRLLFTTQERQFVRANIASAQPDPALVDFFRELDDPQLKEVDMNLASVQGAINYVINEAAPHMSPPYDNNKIEERVSQILSIQFL